MTSGVRITVIYKIVCIHMEYKTSIKSDTSLKQMVQIGGDLASWTDTIGKKSVRRRFIS